MSPSIAVGTVLGSITYTFNISRVNYCIHDFQGNTYDYDITAASVLIRVTGLHMEVAFEP